MLDQPHAGDPTPKVCAPMAPTPPLDDWLRDHQVRTHHRRSAAADADALWEQAAGVRLRDTRTIGRLVSWRIPGVAAEQTFAGLLAEYPFTVLAQGERWSLSGLCGRIWTLHRDYPRLAGPDEWRAWQEPRAAKVLFAHWVERSGDGRATLVSEARVAATDPGGARRLRALWRVIGRFEPLLGAEPLELAVRRAEGASRS